MKIKEYDHGVFLDKLAGNVFLMEVFDYKTSKTIDVITVEIVQPSPGGKKTLQTKDKVLKENLRSGEGKE